MTHHPQHCTHPDLFGPNRPAAPPCGGAAAALCARSWLHLALTPGLGAGSARKLQQVFGCACAAIAQPAVALRGVIEAPVVRALLEPDSRRETDIARAQAWSDKPLQHVLTPADPRYPAALNALHDAPPALFVRGDPGALSRPAIALVGSRNASRDGLDTAREVAAALARAGIVVVSGLAAGIDSAAHRGALSAGGLTVGFVGTGPDLIYPRAHRALAESVIGQGALVSELPLGSPALAHHFPRRNRLIAAQAVAIVVVQAARHSGSLITARLAAELGREVMAFPGSVHSPLSKGTHQLIREGAALVEDAAEIAAILAGALHRQGFDALNAAGLASIDRPQADAPAALPADGPAARVLAALGWAPASADALAQATGLDGASITAALFELELAGFVERLIDGRFVQRGRPAVGHPAAGPFPCAGPARLLASPADSPV